MSKLSERVDVLEASAELIDQEALQALGGSVRALVERQRDKDQDQVKAMALEAVKNALNPFPDYARRHVVQVFTERLEGAERYGRNYRPPFCKQRNVELWRPQIADLLGQ